MNVADVTFPSFATNLMLGYIPMSPHYRMARLRTKKVVVSLLM